MYGLYLPDFFLPRQKLWVEVKPTGAPISEAMKVAALAKEREWCARRAALLEGPIPLMERALTLRGGT